MHKNSVADFLESLKGTGQFDPGDTVLLAVSGGADSVAMAHLFHAAGQKFGIAHCNFQLRGAESDGDEAFVRGLAGQFGVPFFCEKFDTAAFAAAQKVSIQMAARTLRYVFFEKIRAENSFRFIATAHHLDDSRETAMLNFFRGTGLRGLRGMLPIRGNIIRPLLGLTKNELKSIAQKRFPEMAFREDSSNGADRYGRNFLRHQLLPVIEKMAPGFFGNTLDANMARARQLELFLENYTQFLNHQYVQTNGNQTVVDLTTILDLPASHYFLLGEILRPFGFRVAQTIPIISATTGERGRVFLSKEYTLTVDRFRLFIEPIERENPVFEIHSAGCKIELPDGLFVFNPTPAPAEIDPKTASPDRVFFEKKALVFPLTLRHWRAGDRFKPSGMGGQSKKLSDFFKDQKLARPEKDRVWLLENGDGELLWVVGMRRAETGAGATDCFFEIRHRRP